MATKKSIPGPDSAANPPKDGPAVDHSPVFDVAGLRVVRITTGSSIKDDFTSIASLVATAIAILNQDDELSGPSFGAVYLLELAQGAMDHIYRDVAAAQRGAA